MLEKVLLAGVKLYARLVVLGAATEIFTVPVLTHKRSWASKRFTRPILFRLCAARGCANERVRRTGADADDPCF